MEIGPERCAACGSWFGPRGVLVGWDNQRQPKPCRSYTCLACGHVEHVERPRHDDR
ncbi:hypothetical protein TPA4_35 [Tsukamurella phage TPA4]|uniref:hypothetical protein n=1 Tax=Tsukamurella phage TPA4 TaxID=1647476 RepID=UPI0007B62731|nr:hypothetical protein BH784_gp35 [Tsukamurella phage TPA4]AKJ72200.1 hypothetical protein TPA4_35 [Tsukamurella phage TPA4]